MEIKISHNILPANWKITKANGVIKSKSEDLRTEVGMGVELV